MLLKLWLVELPKLQSKKFGRSDLRSIEGNGDSRARKWVMAGGEEAAVPGELSSSVLISLLSVHLSIHKVTGLIFKATSTSNVSHFLGQEAGRVGGHDGPQWSARHCPKKVL